MSGMTHVHDDAFMCLTDICDVTCWYVSHDAFICVTRLTVFMSGMTHVHVMSFYTHAFIAHMRDETHVHDDTLKCLVDMCDVTRWYVWHYVLIYGTWLIHVCDMTHKYVWWDSCALMIHSCVSLTCVTWRVNMWHMADSYMWHDSQICVMKLMCIDDTLMCLVDMCDMTRWYVSHCWFIYVTWLTNMCDETHVHWWYIHVSPCWYIHGSPGHTWIDSYDPLSLWVIFRKSDLYLMALLWKMIYNLGDPMSLRHPIHSWVSWTEAN